MGRGAGVGVVVVKGQNKPFSFVDLGVLCVIFAFVEKKASQASHRGKQKYNTENASNPEREERRKKRKGRRACGGYSQLPLHVQGHLRPLLPADRPAANGDALCVCVCGVCVCKGRARARHTELRSTNSTRAFHSVSAVPSAPGTVRIWYVGLPITSSAPV